MHARQRPGWKSIAIRRAKQNTRQGPSHLSIRAKRGPKTFAQIVCKAATASPGCGALVRRMVREVPALDESPSDPAGMARLGTHARLGTGNRKRGSASIDGEAGGWPGSDADCRWRNLWDRRCAGAAVDLVCCEDSAHESSGPARRTDCRGSAWARACRMPGAEVPGPLGACGHQGLSSV